jgi:hypothetical protein
MSERAEEKRRTSQPPSWTQTNDDGEWLCEKCDNVAHAFLQEGLAGAMVLWCEDCIDDFSPEAVVVTRV